MRKVNIIADACYDEEERGQKMKRREEAQSGQLKYK